MAGHCEGFDEPAAASAERLGEVRMHALLRRSARRVADPAKASLFYLPLWEYTSYAVGQCNGTTHVERMAAAAAALRESAPFARRGGADHFWVSTASLLHAEETAPWLDTRLGDAGPKGYAGLMARVGATLAPLLVLTTVARYKSHGPLRSRVGAEVVEVPFPENRYAAAHATNLGSVRRPTLLFFAGALDVCCTGRPIRCAVAELVGPAGDADLENVVVHPTLRADAVSKAAAVHAARGRTLARRAGAAARRGRANLGARIGGGGGANEARARRR